MERTAAGIAHWDDLAPRAYEYGDIRATRRGIDALLGARTVGLSRYVVPPGARSMPVHRHADEEEIFHVLAGDGLVWIDGETHAVHAGDTIVHRAGGPPHTIAAGAIELDVLAFGSGSPTGLTYLPRPKVFWAGPHWLPADSPHPFAAEAACGPLELPAPQADRPPSIVALADAPQDPADRDGYRAMWRDLATPAGSRDSGLRHVVIEAGQLSSPPHWHGEEEELFVVLAGAGELVLLTDDLTETRTPIAAGHVIARPAGSGVAHALLAGDAGLTYLAYGLRRPGEIIYYPRSQKARLGTVMVRVQPVSDYWDGEP